MANGYVPVNRDQPFLLPPDMRDWLPRGHLVWLVLEVVEGLDTSGLHARRRLGGPGRQGYDPDMLLGLLVYAYCSGVRSSRDIERLCEVDVAFRVLSANRVPDHSTISRFRQEAGPVMGELFGRVLVLCAAAGLTRLGVVAIDGTKMEAAAAGGENRSRVRLEEEVARILEEAEETDRREDELFGEGRGDELPEELADPRTRKERIRRALDELEEREEAIAVEEEARTQRAVEAVARHEQRAAGKAEERAAREAEAAAEGRRVMGRPPHPEGHWRLRHARQRLEDAKSRAATRTAERAGKLKVNVTDPDSRIMKAAGRGFIQGYNAQAAATEDGVVLACDVTQEHNDVAQLEPMMAATEQAGRIVGEPVGSLLFDAGYWSEHNVETLGSKGLIASTRRAKLKHRIEEEGHRQGEPPPDATPLERMEHRLLTEEGADLYRKRGSSIEPVFGNIKQRGARRFMRRGLDAVKDEWRLLCTAHNLLKLHRHHHLPAT